MNKIRFQNKEKISRYLVDAVSLYDPGATSLSGVNIYKFDRIIYVLGNLVGIPGFSDNNNQKQNLISRGVERFSRYKRKSTGQFAKALVVETKKRESQSPSKFFVVFPLNVSYKTLKGKRHFMLGETKLKTRSYTNVWNNFDFERPYFHLRERRRRFEGSIYDFTYIIVEVHARNQKDAFETARRQVELFRSLCNLTLSYGMIMWQSGYPSPLGRINPSKYMFVFNDKRRFLDYWFSVGDFRYRLLKLEARQLEAINKIVKDYEALKSNKLKNLLVNCLALYTYALDEIEPGYIFLNLWQILELIALKEPGGIPLRKVKDRIKVIFRGNQIISDLLDALFHKRNRLVHEGQLGNFSLRDVNQIKGIAEGCIGFLLAHVNKLKNKEGLRDFYENIGQKQERLNKKMSVLRYVKKIARET